jgi:hypothetical protein
LYEGELRFGYQTTPGSWVGSGPVGLAIGKTGEIYLASPSLGIFVLPQDGNRYKLKQLLFHER